jgi:hypothetical protein
MKRFQRLVLLLAGRLGLLRLLVLLVVLLAVVAFAHDVFLFVSGDGSDERL